MEDYSPTSAPGYCVEEVCRLQCWGGVPKQRPGVLLSWRDGLKFRQAKLARNCGAEDQSGESYTLIEKERFLKLCRGVYSHLCQRTDLAWVTGNHPRLR